MLKHKSRLLKLNVSFFVVLRHWLHQNNSKIQLINLTSLTFLDFEVIFIRLQNLGTLGWCVYYLSTYKSRSPQTSLPSPRKQPQQSLSASLSSRIQHWDRFVRYCKRYSFRSGQWQHFCSSFVGSFCRFWHYWPPDSLSPSWTLFLAFSLLHSNGFTHTSQTDISPLQSTTRFRHHHSSCTVYLRAQYWGPFSSACTLRLSPIS